MSYSFFEALTVPPGVLILKIITFGEISVIFSRFFFRSFGEMINRFVNLEISEVV